MNARSLTHRTSTGLGWLTAGSLLGKVFGLASQVVFGYLLIEEQFGAWAAVLGFNVIAGSLRDLAVVDLMIRGGREELDENFGPALWIGASSGLGVAAIMVVLGYALSGYYDNPDFAFFNLCYAGVCLLKFPGTIFRGLLSVDLLFKEIAVATTTGSIARTVAGITAAALGAGVYSFLFAFLAESLAITAMTARYARFEGLPFGPNFPRWIGLLRDTPGLLLSRLGMALTNGGDLLVLGLLASPVIGGVYYMAFLLINQFSALFGPGVLSVLLPSFSRLRHEPERLRAALGRALRAQSLAVGFGCGGLLAVSDASMRFVWADKWVAAILPAQILLLAMPFRISAGVAIPALRAEGRFYTDAALTLGQGLALPAGIAAGSIAGFGVAGITACGAGMLTLVQLCHIAAPFAGAGGAAPVRIAGRVLAQVSGPLLLGVAIQAAGEPARASGVLPGGRAGEALLLAGGAAVYACLAWGMLLSVYRRPAIDALAALPDRLSAHVARLPGGRRLLAA